MPALPHCDVSAADRRRPRLAGAVAAKLAFWFPGAHVGAVGDRPAGRALAHVVQNRVEAACAGSDLFEPRRLPINDWAQYLGEERGQVVTLRR